MISNSLYVEERCKYRLPCGWCDRKNCYCQMANVATGISYNTLSSLPDTELSVLKVSGSGDIIKSPTEVTGAVTFNCPGECKNE